MNHITLLLITLVSFNVTLIDAQIPYLNLTYEVITDEAYEKDESNQNVREQLATEKVDEVAEETTEVNLRNYDPNAEKWSLVKLDPSLNQPQPVVEYSTIRPSAPTGSPEQVKQKVTSAKNATQISSHKPQVVQASPIISPSSSAMRILTTPLRNLVMRSFEGYRRLMKDAQRIEDTIRTSLGLPKRMRLRSLDPLDIPEPVVLEHRDKNIPILGKLVFTLSDIVVAGLSNFRVEQLDGYGRNLYFQHLIPHLDSVANYTMDYHLFDAIPFRVSSGHLTARVPNARVKGSFQIFPDLVNVWFKVAQLNLTTWVEDLNIRFYPEYLISERFAIDKSTVEKIHTAFSYFLPNITDVLKLTYSKAIEMKLV